MNEKWKILELKVFRRRIKLLSSQWWAGDDFLERYLRRVEEQRPKRFSNHRTKQKMFFITSAGLHLPSPEPIPTTNPYQSPFVPFHTKPSSTQTRLATSSGFVANGRWQGNPTKGLLKAPTGPRVHKAPVVLDSPSARLVGGFGFAPNGGWEGQPETSLLEYVPDSRRRNELGGNFSVIV